LDSLADLKNWQRRAREIGRNKCGLICGFAGQYVNISKKFKFGKFNLKLPCHRAGKKRNVTSFARWFIFKPKISIWVNFEGPWNGKCRYILWPLGIFDGHFMTICYIFVYIFGTFFRFWYHHIPRKIWQPST
jgi:hypothetical protein